MWKTAWASCNIKVCSLVALIVFIDDAEIMQVHQMRLESNVRIEINDVVGIMQLHDLLVDGTARVQR